MRRISPLLLALFVVACLSTPPIASGPGLGGRYVVNGVDPVGLEYSGLVTIVDSGANDDLVFEWIVTGAILEGSGRRRGDRVEVIWSTVSGPRGDSAGTASYTIVDGNRLVGTRTIDGLDGEGTEEIFPEP